MLRIAEARHIRNWSQEQLAEAVGTTQQTIQRWETGAVDPKISKVEAMSAALGVTMSFLLGVDPIEYDSSAALSCEHAVSGPLGTRLGRKKAAPTHGDGLPRWPKPWRGRIIS